MKKSLFVFSLCLAMAGVVSAQTKLDMELNHLVHQQRVARAAQRMANGHETVSEPNITVFARLVAGQDIPAQQLDEMGAVIGRQYGSFLCLTLPVGSLEQLASLEQFSRIDRIGTTSLHNRNARSAAQVEVLQNPATALLEGLPHEYTGKGVLVGVVDSGIDFQHANYYDPATGESRIKGAVIYHDYTVREDEELIDQDGNPCSIEMFRSEYSDPAEIEQLTTDTRKTGHGSHTSGIAAGSYRGAYLNQNGGINYTEQQGMAPEADLLLVGLGDGPYADILSMDAFDRLSRKSEELGQPMVINYSMGASGYWLDGKNVSDLFVKELTDDGNKPGLVICNSAGNEGNKGWTLYQRLDESNHNKLRFGLFCFNQFPSFIQPGVTCRLYCDDDTPFEVNLEFYEETSDGYQRVDSLTYTDSELKALGLLTADNYSAHDGRFAASISLKEEEEGGVQWPEGVSPCLYITSQKECNIRVFHLASAYGAHEAFDIQSLNLAEEGTIESGNSCSSISPECCSDAVISVGSWFMSNHYFKFSGEEYDSPDTPGRIAASSSYCIADDNGKQHPDVCAPGESLISGLNMYCSGSWPYHDGSDACGVAETEYQEGHQSIVGFHSGTSMSCPVVTGIVALWLQADPTLSVRDVREIIRATADQDEFTADAPERFGAGKINALKGLKFILENRPVAIQEVCSDQNRQSETSGKYIRQGKLIIHQNGQQYNAMGQKM